MKECKREDCKGVSFQNVLMSSYCWEMIKYGLCRKYERTQVKGM